MKEKRIGVLDLKIDEMVFDNLPLEQRLETLIEIWNSDSDRFEEVDEELDLEEKTLQVLSELEDERLLKEIERLDAAMRNQAHRYKDLSQYVSHILIPLFLAEDRENSEVKDSRLREYLTPFYKNPVNCAEIFFEVLDKLICYDQSALAVEICKKTYSKIVNSKEFFYNPLGTLEDIIMFDELQEVYLKLKNNLEVDWISFSQKMKPYGYEFPEDELKKYGKIMLDQIDLNQMVNSFKKESHDVLIEIKLIFCCYMYDLDKTSFVTSLTFSDMIIDFLYSIPGRKRSPLHVFFKVKESFLMNYVLDLQKGWFDRTYKIVAFLATFPIFYLTLHKKGILAMKTVEEALATTIVLKSEFKQNFSVKPWKYNFISKLESQASILALKC
jgi:hypothetical protein